MGSLHVHFESALPRTMGQTQAGRRGAGRSRLLLFCRTRQPGAAGRGQCHAAAPDAAGGLPHRPGARARGSPGGVAEARATHRGLERRGVRRAARDPDPAHDPAAGGGQRLPHSHRGLGHDPAGCAKLSRRRAARELYGERWQVELHFQQIKTLLAMDVLRCKSPQLIQREVALHRIAYNPSPQPAATQRAPSSGGPGADQLQRIAR